MEKRRQPTSLLGEHLDIPTIALVTRHRHPTRPASFLPVGDSILANTLVPRLNSTSWTTGLLTIDVSRVPVIQTASTNLSIQDVRPLAGRRTVEARQRLLACPTRSTSCTFVFASRLPCAPCPRWRLPVQMSNTLAVPVRTD
jgi:hypothetical protein